ncbi:putative mitochondrial protein, partial [Mucuna pruriens]
METLDSGHNGNALVEINDNLAKGIELEDPPPLSLVSNDQSLENILGLSSSNTLVNTINTSTMKKAKYPIANHVSSQRLSYPFKEFLYQLSFDQVPNKIQKALKDSKWVQAMKEEMKALKDNNIRNIISPPREKKIVGCKWVFSIKHRENGSIKRYKAKLVAKGYTQTYGIDY